MTEASLHPAKQTLGNSHGKGRFSIYQLRNCAPCSHSHAPGTFAITLSCPSRSSLEEKPCHPNTSALAEEFCYMLIIKHLELYFSLLRL